MHASPDAHPSGARARRATPLDRLAHPPRLAVRAALAALAAGALVAVFLIVQPPPSASAADVFGALRAPGESAVIIGHRGDRARAPENTMPSLGLALDEFAFVETDVQLTRDGVPVLFHDVDLMRVAGVPHRIGDLTLAQVRRLDVGRSYDDSFAGTRIPTLDEFLTALAERDEARALVELKASWTPEEVGIVGALIERRGVRDRVVLETFSVETLDSITRVAPSLSRIMLIRELPADPRPLAERFGVIGFGTTVASVTAQPQALTLAHEAGVAVLAYTLNSEKTWAEVGALGVDGIITDRPSELDSWLAVTSPGT
ncbi:glycerophosphodiester phosphodiesterase [Agromyces sp. MMS24-K17]|uniref:glycerophosphodiester phosphodiesterase n=1 Tax=Agromyces sp. MMS24-K17 TaxID=3372850 RepID=UPI0037547844